jgi:hypothetical protein
VGGVLESWSVGVVGERGPKFPFHEFRARGRERKGNSERSTSNTQRPTSNIEAMLRALSVRLAGRIKSGNERRVKIGEGAGSEEPGPKTRCGGESTEKGFLISP